MALLRAWAQKKAGRREKGAQNQNRGGRLSGSSWRDGRQTTYGNNIAGDGNKKLCCLIEGKEHRGERSGGAALDRSSTLPVHLNLKQRKAHKKMCAKSLTTDASTLREILGAI